uniref:vitellogenin-like n=1 Tax=Pristiophorus japonicus TaxID=55135 RepID=UPI00398E4E1B
MTAEMLSASIAFAVSSTLSLVPFFSHSKTYIYLYEGSVLTGLPEDGLAKGGLRITSKVQISSMGQKNHLLKLISPQIQEYSGISPDDQFIPARKLTRKLSAQLSKPIKFEYSHGRVGNIYASPGISENILNIYRGILNILQISIKKSQNIYELQENGVEGICHASYVIQEDKRAGVITVTKSKDLNNCQEKISETKGAAHTQLCETCQLKGKSLRSVSTYTYAMKSTEGGAEISEVRSQETHQFTPFNELEGAASTESRQHLFLLELKNESPPMPTFHMEKRGTLRYQFSNELLQMPMQLVKLSHNDTKIANAIENLVQINREKAHPDAPYKFLQLIQLLRSANLENLQSIWKKNAAKQDHRRWFLDTLPTTATHEAIQFLQTRIEQKDLTQFEAAQALVFVLHSLKADCHGVDNATVLLSSPYMKSNPFLRRITLLAYGSLVQRYCTTIRVCPDEALRPLHELVVEAGSRGQEEETILGLKAIGNAGQPASLKRIQKLLPGFGNAANGVSSRIQAEAVMALRNIAKKEPRKVQVIAIQLIMNKKNHVEVRLRAFIVLLESKPSLAFIATVTDSLTRETNLQLSSFAYSYMKSLAGTSLPELQSLATACNIAVKRLNRKCDTLSYRYSKGFHFGVFKDKYLAGINANFYSLKKSEGILPTAAVANVKVYGLGVTTDFLEIGIQAEGLQQALLKKNQPSRKGPRSNDTERVMGKVSGWKPIPAVKPLVVAYIKLFGQELAFVELNQNDIQEAMKLMNNQARKDVLIKKFINQLQRGITTQWTKPLLATEVRHIVPTSLGLPIELAFYYTVVSAVTAQAKVKFTPVASNFTVAQLLNTSIQTDAQLILSSVKDVTAIMGINTPLIQTGVEVQLKTSTVIPVNFTAKVNLKKRNVKIETPPGQQENQLFSARSQAFAFSRNIENLNAAKVTPLLPKEEFGMRNRELRLAKNSTTDHKRMMRVLPLALPLGSVCSAENIPDVPSSTIHQACAKTNTFGFEVCYKTSMENAVFATNSPLYKIIGEKSVEVTIKPVTTPIAIKKLQIELQIQTGDQSVAKVSHLMKKHNRSDTDFPETTQPGGKLVLLKLKKMLETELMFQVCDLSLQYSVYRVITYLTIASACAETLSHSTRKHQDWFDENDWEIQELINCKHRAYPNLKQQFNSGAAKQLYRWLKAEVQQKARDLKYNNIDKREHRYTTSISASTYQASPGVNRQSNENKKKHTGNQYRHAPTSQNRGTDHDDCGEHAQSKQEHGARPHHGSSRPLTRQSTSSSSSSAQSKQEHGARPHHGSSRPLTPQSKEQHGARQRSVRKSRRQQLSSSSSSEQSRRKKAVTRSSQHPTSTEKCNNGHCKDTQLSKPIYRPTIRNSSLSTTASLSQSSSISSSAQSKEKYGEHSKHASSSMSSSSESSSSRSSSDRSRHRHSKHSRREQSSSSSSVGTSSSSVSWNRKGGGINPNILQFHFKPSSGNLSQNRGRLNFESSSASSSTSKMSFSSSSSSSSSSQQSVFLGDSVPPIFSLLTRAITVDNKEKGYQTKAYVDISMEERAMQIFVDELNGGSWRACVDAEMPNVHRAVAVLKWGKDCQDYKIAAKAATGHFEHHPAILVKAQWDKIPQSIKETAAMLADQLAVVAFMLGFSERHQKNRSHRLSVIAAATSQRTLDIVVKSSKVLLISLTFPPQILLGTPPNLCQAAARDTKSGAEIQPPDQASGRRNVTATQRCRMAAARKVLLRDFSGGVDIRPALPTSAPLLPKPPTHFIKVRIADVPPRKRNSAEKVFRPAAHAPDSFSCQCTVFGKVKVGGPHGGVRFQGSVETWPHGVQFWALHFRKDVKALENGQRRWNAECTVVQNKFTQFSENSFEYQMPEGCAHVLVQDCTAELKFIVLIRHSAESLLVQLILPFSYIEMESTTGGTLQLSIDGEEKSIASLPFTSSRFFTVERSDNGLKIKAPEFGLGKLSFDGKLIKVAIMQWMAGSTCGLCGQGNSQGKNEYQQPNKRNTEEILKFAHSWLLPGENCKDGNEILLTCKLMKRTVKLEKPVNLHGQESKCYSVDPVLCCQTGCSPVKTVPVTYGFHCLPADSHVNPTEEQLISSNFGQKSEDLVDTVEAHIACSCPSECN